MDTRSQTAKTRTATVCSLGTSAGSRAGNYLNRIIRKHTGKSPRVKKARSFCLDANMYDVFEEGGVQYISIMTLSRGKRVPIPKGSGQRYWLLKI